MIDRNPAPYGTLLLRVSMGVLFLLQGVYLTFFIFGMEKLKGSVTFRTSSVGDNCI